MHGFNQGEDFLKDACDLLDYDIILLQEHLLNTQNLPKILLINENYIVFGGDFVGYLLSALFVSAQSTRTEEA